MKSYSAKGLACLLVFTLLLGPVAPAALAQEKKDAAPDAQVQTVRQLAKRGYLGDKKDTYLSAKTLTEDEITDALLKINDSLSAVDLKALKPGDASYKPEELKELLKLLQDKKEDVLARKVSAWKLENQIKKMLAALEPPAAEEAEPLPTATPRPTATFTPVPAVTKAEWEEMKGDLKDLTKKVDELQTSYDKRIDALQRANEDSKTLSTDLQEQLRLVKRILEHVQADLKKSEDRIEEVGKKASEKSMTDVELQQELTIMHKDIRDHSQDVSILKQQVAKLNKSDNHAGESALDSALNSKWLAGGALVVGLTALVIALTNK